MYTTCVYSNPLHLRSFQMQTPPKDAQIAAISSTFILKANPILVQWMGAILFFPPFHLKPNMTILKHMTQSATVRLTAIHQHSSAHVSMWSTFPITKLFKWCSHQLVLPPVLIQFISTAIRFMLLPLDIQSITTPLVLFKPQIVIYSAMISAVLKKGVWTAVAPDQDGR